MVFIESAFLGDERGMRNVTKVLHDRIVGTSIDVPVDDRLIPPFEVVDNTTLTTAEDRELRAQAERECGGPDQGCIDVQMGKLRQLALDAKSTKANSSANVIKGRRLTVNVLDDQGKRRRMVIPDGHEFKIDGLSPTDPRKPDQVVPDFVWFKGQFIEFSAVAVVTFVWVFGIVATFALFARAGFGYLAWALAGIAFLIPGSGYVMIFLYFILNSFVNNYTSMV